MAHDKVFGICENKCLTEVYAKDEVYAKNEVYAKDDFVILDTHSNVTLSTHENVINSGITTSIDDVNKYAVVSVMQKIGDAGKWQTFVAIYDNKVFPNVTLQNGYMVQINIYLPAVAEPREETVYTRAVLMRVSD